MASTTPAAPANPAMPARPARPARLAAPTRFATPATRAALVAVAALLLGAVACSDLVLEPEEAGVVDEAVDDADDQADPSDPSGIGTTAPVSSLIADRAWVLDPERSPLVSTGEQLAAGEYRFRDTGAALDSIRRDDAILALVGEERVPRRVLSVETEGDVRVLDTGPALWSDVINSGRYGLTAPIGPGTATTLAGDQMTTVPSVGESAAGRVAGGALANDASTGTRSVRADVVAGDEVAVGAGESIPPFGGEFELDFCAVTDSIAAVDPELEDVQLCGREQTIDQIVKGIKITLAGTLDSLAIQDGGVEVSGSMSIDMLVDGGGVEGGRPPVFAPCHRANHPGCLATPTGAAWIDWLRLYAPNVPEASLRPVRICVPGTRVRVKAGYWDTSGLVPIWVPPEYERCRITDVGELPTVVPPSVRSVTAVAQPRVRGGMTLVAQADGRLGIRVPIPKMGYAAKQGSGDISAEFKAGIFVDVGLTVKNTSGRVRADFDEEIRITQSWTPDDGWSQETASIRSMQSSDYDFGNPDSITVKTFLPVVAVGVEMKVEPDGVDRLAVTAKEGIEFGPYMEVIWSREQIDPDDPEIDNWHLAAFEGYEIKPSAGIELPDAFDPPNVETSWSPTFEFGRVRTSDDWGLANLIVETSTTGTDIDPDGYSVIVSRSDTLPVIIQEGAERYGEARDHGSPTERSIGTTEATVFERGAVSCMVTYSDTNSPVAKNVLRTAGLTIPNYATAGTGFGEDCNLLVARHTVELTGVAANCVVDGGPVRDDVWLLQRRFGLDARDDTTRVVFDVECGMPVAMGALSVTADVPTVLDGPFEVRVDGALGALIGAGETKVIDQLAAGAGRQVELTGLPDYCTTSPVDVEVISGETVDVQVTADCEVPTVDLEGTVTASVVLVGGPEPDEDMAVWLDGEPRAGVRPDRDAIIDGLEASTPATLMLTRVPGHCRFAGRNPIVIEPDASLSPVFVDFETECATAAVDTLDGAVAVTAYPVPSASIDADADGGGESLRLTGPLAEAFLQLAGVDVRVWGVRAGTSLDVYGYEVRSSLGEPRWIGIVAERDGTFWLFGDDAIELVDPPAGLASRVGALVWVGGDEVGAMPTRVVPRVYGVITEAGS